MSESTGETMATDPKSPEKVEQGTSTENLQQTRPRRGERLRRILPKVHRKDRLAGVRDELGEMRPVVGGVAESLHPVDHPKDEKVDTQPTKEKKKLKIPKNREKNEHAVRELSEVAKTGSFKDVWAKAIEFFDYPIPEGKEDFYKNELPTVVNTMINGNAEEKRDAEVQLKALMERNNLSRKEKLQLRVALPLIKRAMRHREMPVGRDERESPEESTVQPAPPDASEDTPSPEEREATEEVTGVINEATNVADSDEPDEIKMTKWQSLMIKLKEFGDKKIPHTVLILKNEKGEPRRFHKNIPYLKGNRIGLYLPFIGGKTVKENAWGALGVLMTVAATMIIAYLWGMASLAKAGGK